MPLNDTDTNQHPHITDGEPCPASVVVPIALFRKLEAENRELRRQIAALEGRRLDTP